MCVQHHAAAVELYKNLFHSLARREDTRDQLLETFDTHTYHFEKAVEIANFSEVSHLKDLLQRSQTDIEVVAAEIQEGAVTLQSRYRAMWELERILYQRFRHTGMGMLTQEVDFELLQQHHSAAFDSTVDFSPKPLAVEPFAVMLLGPNLIRNACFAKGEVHTHTHTHVHVLSHTHTITRTHTQTNTHTLTDRHTHKHSHTHRNTNTPTHTQTNTHIYTNTHLVAYTYQHRQTHSNIPTHTNTPTQRHTHTQAQIQIHTHTLIHTDTNGQTTFCYPEHLNKMHIYYSEKHFDCIFNVLKQTRQDGK